MPYYSYASIQENHGQTLLWRATRGHATPPLDVERVARLEYIDAVYNREAFNFQPFAVIEQQLRRWKAA